MAWCLPIGDMQDTRNALEVDKLIAMRQADLDEINQYWKDNPEELEQEFSFTRNDEVIKTHIHYSELIHRLRVIEGWGIPKNHGEEWQNLSEDFKNLIAKMAAQANEYTHLLEALRELV